MSWSFSIGRLFGSELRIHATFFLLLAWIGTAAWIDAGPAAAVFNVVFIVALFACVVAHEFGHALMARRFGVKTPDITLLPIGGMARLEKIPEKPAEEIAVAVAGPLVNVVIWLVLVVLFGPLTDLESLADTDLTVSGFLQRLAMVNLFLVLFNMIPAFPMDGGRVLRAALAIRMGRAQATRAAALAGQVMAFVFGYLGLSMGNPLLVLIAIFVFMAAAAENSDVQLHDMAKTALVRDAVITTFEVLEPEDTLDAAASALLRTTQSEFPVLDANRSLIGFVTKADIVRGYQQDEMKATVRSFATKDVPVVLLMDPMEAVIDQMQQSSVPVVAVTDQAGAFVGYVSRENLGEWVLLKGGTRTS